MSATGSVIVMGCFLRSPGFDGLSEAGDLWWWCLSAGGLLRLGVVAAGRGADVTEKRAALVIRLRGRDDRDVEAADAVDPVLVDLVEDRLLLQTERVVAVAVELL